MCTGRETQCMYIIHVLRAAAATHNLESVGVIGKTVWDEVKGQLFMLRLNKLTVFL